MKETKETPPVFSAPVESRNARSSEAPPWHVVPSVNGCHGGFTVLAPSNNRVAKYSFQNGLISWKVILMMTIIPSKWYLELKLGAVEKESISFFEESCSLEGVTVILASTTFTEGTLFRPISLKIPASSHLIWATAEVCSVRPFCNGHLLRKKASTKTERKLLQAMFDLSSNGWNPISFDRGCSLSGGGFRPSVGCFYC